MAELRFIVDNSAIETVQKTELKANFTEMKTALTEFAEPYKNLIVSEDGIAVAKADRAKLRSVAKHIDDYRKMVKKTYSEPLKKFEAKCKELTDICDEAATNIDVQVKEYERIRKEEKIFLLKDFYANAVNPFPEYATWEYLYDEHWENKSYSSEQAHRDIVDGIARVAKEVQSIYYLHSEFELTLLDHYKQSHEIVSVLALNERLTEQKRQKEEAERKNRERMEEIERERKRQEALAKPAPSPVPDEYPFEDVVEPFPDDEIPFDVPSAEDIEKAMKAEEEPHYVSAFRVYGTYEEISMVRQFLTNSNIPYLSESLSETTLPVEIALG